MSIITFNSYNNPVINTIMPVTILLRTVIIILILQMRDFKHSRLIHHVQD